MGFTRPETNKSIWRNKPDVLKDQSATVKADFDRLLNENSEDMVTMIEELEDKSGAGEIGAVAKDGVTASTIQAELNKVSNLEGVTATPEELNVLDGVVITTGELNYLDGVTSNVQAQINSKANTVHTHGNLSEDGKIGTAAGKVITTGTNGILQAETECTAFNKNYETNAANMKANAATASVGSADTIARGDHIHPTDTTRQASIGAVNGILKGDGAGNIVSAVGGTDYARVPAIEVVTGYEKATLSADIVETDTVNEALGKLEKKVESAISGGVNSVFGRSGTVVAQSGDYTAEQVGAIRAAAPYSVVTEADLDTWIDTQCLCAPASSGTLRTLMGSRCYVTQLFYNGVGTSYSRCQIAWGYTTTNIAYRYYYVSGSSGSWSEWGQVYTSTSGYGLGGNVKVAAGQDANQITATGFYSCDTNTPTSEWYFGYHIQRSDAYAYQRFINSFSFEIYERQKTAGEWSEWKKVWPLAASDVGAVPISGGTMTGTLFMQQNTSRHTGAFSSSTSGTNLYHYLQPSQSGNYNQAALILRKREGEGADILFGIYNDSSTGATYKVYSEFNIKISTSAPSAALENGEQYQVYSA